MQKARRVGVETRKAAWRNSAAVVRWSGQEQSILGRRYIETRNAINGGRLFDDLATNGREARVDEQEALILRIHTCVWSSRRREDSGENGVR